jgi:MinD superfamily P-loop ATPase
MKIAIASGKGGAGKTTVAVNLAYTAPEPVVLLDCDVEEPNCHLFLAPEPDQREAILQPVPLLDALKCNGCGRCGRICQFHAIAFLGSAPLLYTDMCHSCGGCTTVCPTGALREVGQEIGTIETGTMSTGALVYGRLNVGRAISPPLIRAVRQRAFEAPLVLVDCPPGTSCPLVAAVEGCDFALLVCEPTPFGVHDLQLVVDTVRALDIPCGIVVNRGNADSQLVHAFSRRTGVPVLQEIPEDKDVARAYAMGQIGSREVPSTRAYFESLWKALLALRKPVRKDC